MTKNNKQEKARPSKGSINIVKSLLCMMIVIVFQSKRSLIDKQGKCNVLTAKNFRKSD